MTQRNGLLQRLLNDPERRISNQTFVIRQPQIGPRPPPNQGQPGPSRPNPEPGPSSQNPDRPATPPNQGLPEPSRPIPEPPGPIPGPNPGPSRPNDDRPQPERPRNPRIEFARLMMSGLFISFFSKMIVFHFFFLKMTLMLTVAL